ncbi:hypothetical protein D9M69_396150 [compost metagenome]
MAHQGALNTVLAWERGLPLPGHPVLHHWRAAVGPIFDHAVYTQGGQLGVAVRFGAVELFHHTAGQGRQEALREQRQVGLIDLGTNRTSLVEPQVSHQRPGVTVVAVDGNRVADLVQWLQQVASGRVQLAVDGAGTEGAAALQNIQGFVAVHRVVVVPPADNQKGSNRGDAKT